MLKKLYIHFLVVAALLLAGIQPSYATAALTANGVQCGTVTIASGATTGTATLSNAVGTGAFLLYNGQTTAVTTANPATGIARITKTNSTTITATRNTSTTAAISTNFCMVDGDTTNLIQSVQYGTITFGTSATGTAAISAVTTANTAVGFLGFTTTDTTTSPLTQWPALSLTSTTQVTATVGSAPGTNSITVAFVVIEFKSGALQSLQAIADAASPAGTTRTKTITSVTLNNTFLIYAGHLTTGGASYSSGDQYGQLTAATTLTIGTNAGPSVSIQYNAYVVELVAAMVETAAQRGNISIAAGTSNTAALSPNVTLADAMLTYGGNQTNGTTFNTRNAKLATTASTVTATTNTSATTKTGWEVIALNPAGAAASPFGGNNKWISLDGL